MRATPLRSDMLSRGPPTSCDSETFSTRAVAGSGEFAPLHSVRPPSTLFAGGPPASGAPWGSADNATGFSGSSSVSPTRWQGTQPPAAANRRGIGIPVAGGHATPLRMGMPPPPAATAYTPASYAAPPLSSVGSMAASPLYRSVSEDPPRAHTVMVMPLGSATVVSRTRSLTPPHVVVSRSNTPVVRRIVPPCPGAAVQVRTLTTSVSPSPAMRFGSGALSPSPGPPPVTLAAAGDAAGVPCSVRPVSRPRMVLPPPPAPPSVRPSAAASVPGRMVMAPVGME